MSRLSFLISASLLIVIDGSLVTSEASIADVPHETKVQIGKKLKGSDLQSYGQVSKDFNKAMKEALITHTAFVNASQLKAENIVNLRMIGSLGLEIDSDVDNKLMARIGQLTNLKALDLRAAQVTDDGLVHLKGLLNLEWIQLPAQTSDAGLINLQDLKKLRDMDLRMTQVTGEGFKHLKNLPNLIEINLNGSPATDQGLSSLKDIPNIKRLYLSMTKITDAGLPHLYGLKNLTTVQLSGTTVTPAAIQALKDHFKKEYSRDLTVYK